MDRVFNKVLVANRGAIAVRIERTLRRLGIASIAVYTRADEDSLHVEQADEAVFIGDGPAKDSYLNQELIIQTALDTGVEAIHPGYGFLSENAQFARACRQHNIAFIGPTPEQIELFGLKHSARQIAMKAGVPLLPGTGLLRDLEEAVLAANQIGFPVIVKSSAGGGGIGMQVCEDETALRVAYDTVRHLAETNFKDDGLFLEKYVSKARHVEVQLFGNRFGEVVTLGERDCSIQRRNRKVLEESPFPVSVRQDMYVSAQRLASEVGYKSAGTVEFLYDPENQKFYFLEVNTRLQVEHGITEEVLGIDLVEWMVKEAADELKDLDSLLAPPQGHSIEARIYAEDCLQQFRPSAGRIDRLALPTEARVETWLRTGIKVTSLYDPMLAKVIVRGTNRADAIYKLSQALANTRCYGLTTNLNYLQALLKHNGYQTGHVYTGLLNGFEAREHALEVMDGGVHTTVQDWPGRTGYWDVGVPPSGPMDPLSFRIGNMLLGNDMRASGLELTLRGGSYRFRDDTWFCVTGAAMQATLNNEPVPMYKPIKARYGQLLSFGEAKNGMRTYLLVAGGFDLPETLGSVSTFVLGGIGGHGGRVLAPGDVLGIRSDGDITERFELPTEHRPKMSHTWTIGVIPGPHSSTEFLQPSYLKHLTETRWEVHFNSSRTGVRLTGPVPQWARQDGGDAGLHPSNIHDNPYAIGALDLTGDMPILLGPDGPSLGGFICPVTTAKSELWKIGQLRPGDTVSFQLLTSEDGEEMRVKQENLFNTSWKDHSSHENILDLPQIRYNLPPDYALLVCEKTNRRFPITIRRSGSENLLVEYGEMELDLLLRFQVHALMQAIQQADIPLVDLTPGIRSLQIHFDADRIKTQELCEQIMDLERHLPPPESVRVPSRIVRLPLAWDDPSTQVAIERYQQNVRPDAPWCPSNIEFIRRVNGLETTEEVKRIVLDANYLVLGLGDVYLGAPVAIPTDPRHQLVTTKYNPARTWTPENAVGIGGAYMCIYGMEGPGGYQFVGRTIQVWNSLRTTENFEAGKPWLLRFFDQIRFYQVDPKELLQLREDFLRGRFKVDIIETEFDLGEYVQYIDSIRESTEIFRIRQQKAFKTERENWKLQGLAEYVSDSASFQRTEQEQLPPGVQEVSCNMPGSVWKVLVKPKQEELFLLST